MMRRTTKHSTPNKFNGQLTPRSPGIPQSPVIAGSKGDWGAATTSTPIASLNLPTLPSTPTRLSSSRRQRGALPLILWILLPVNPILLIGLHVYHSVHRRGHSIVAKGVITRHHPKVTIAHPTSQTKQGAGDAHRTATTTSKLSAARPIPATNHAAPVHKLSKSNTTVVTAFFPVKSKYGISQYKEWMANFLSLKDAMVIFLPDRNKELKDSVIKMRKHAPTHIVQMNLEDVPLAKNYDIAFWETQFQKDPEKKRHASYQLFWIWLSKTWWLAQAIEQNPFRSELWMWSDIGCFRGAQGKNYVGKEMMAKAHDIVPTSSMLFMSHKETPEPPKSLWWHRKLREPQHFYHSGTMMAGYASVVQDFHRAFVQTLNGFRERNLFVGDDQVVLQCTCLQNPAMCAYVTRDQVRDNHYFGLRFALHHGGNYTLWRPPPMIKSNETTAVRVT